MFQRSESGYTCVDEHSVKLDTLLFECLCQCSTIRNLTSIVTDRNRVSTQPSLRLIKCGLIAPCYHHASSFMCKREGCCQSNTTISARNQCGLTFKSPHNIFLLLFNLSSSSPSLRSFGTLPIIRRGSVVRDDCSVNAAFPSHEQQFDYCQVLISFFQSSQQSGMVYALVHGIGSSGRVERRQAHEDDGG